MDPVTIYKSRDTTGCYLHKATKSQVTIQKLTN